MKLDIKRHNIEITADSVLDEVFIEEVLKLAREGDICELVKTGSTRLKTRVIALQDRDMVSVWQPNSIAEHLDNSPMTTDLAKLIETFAYRMRKQELNMLDFSSKEVCLGKLADALAAQDFVTVATMAMYLDKDDDVWEF